MKPCKHGHVDGAMHRPCYQCRAEYWEAQAKSKHIDPAQWVKDNCEIGWIASTLKLPILEVVTEAVKRYQLDTNAAQLAAFVPLTTAPYSAPFTTDVPDNANEFEITTPMINAAAAILEQHRHDYDSATKYQRIARLALEAAMEAGNGR